MRASPLFFHRSQQILSIHHIVKKTNQFEMDNDSTMAIKKRIDFSSTNHNFSGSAEFSINSINDQQTTINDTLPRIQYNTDCETSFNDESKIESLESTPSSRSRPKTKTNSIKLRKFQSLNIQYVMETDPNKKELIKQQMDRYDAIT